MCGGSLSLSKLPTPCAPNTRAFRPTGAPRKASTSCSSRRCAARRRCCAPRTTGPSSAPSRCRSRARCCTCPTSTSSTGSPRRATVRSSPSWCAAPSRSRAGCAQSSTAPTTRSPCAWTHC
eukprot:scaffold58664_cov42-Phaeocystis_antarctica.AAC.1